MTMTLQPDRPDDVHLLVADDHPVGLLRDLEVVVVVDEPRDGMGMQSYVGEAVVERLLEPGALLVGTTG